MPAPKILVIRFSSIGDIVLTTPVLRVLKEQLEAEIHFCSKKAFASILENNPNIDKTHYLESSLKDLIRNLRGERFDYIIDLHGNLRSFLIKRSIKGKSYTFDKLNRYKWLYVNLKINKMPSRHIVDRYLDTIKPLGAYNDHKGLEYYIPSRDEVEASWLPDDFQQQYVVYAIGGQHYTKKLPVSRMIELCDKINKPVILLGGPEDKEAGEEVERFFRRSQLSKPYEDGLWRMNKKTIVFNGCGKFNINQSASIIKNASVVFTHDTGLMHIAAAFEKEVFSIWGNTTPFFGMYPYKTKFTVLENNNLNCRPCSKIGHQKCPKGHFKCMQELPLNFFLP